MSFTPHDEWPLAPGTPKLQQTNDARSCTHCGKPTLTFVTSGKYLAVYACSSCGRSVGLPDLQSK